MSSLPEITRHGGSGGRELSRIAAVGSKTLAAEERSLYTLRRACPNGHKNAPQIGSMS